MAASEEHSNGAQEGRCRKYLPCALLGALRAHRQCYLVIGKWTCADDERSDYWICNWRDRQAWYFSAAFLVRRICMFVPKELESRPILFKDLMYLG